ncbi:MAG: monovalent cation/H+ antiporter subunit D family protein [Micropepsaceae bacterium]
MSEILAQLPALQVVLPLLAAILIVFLRHETFSFLITLGVCLLLPVMSAAMLMEVLANGPISYALGGWPPPFGIEYRVDLLNAIVLLLVSVIAAVTIPFAYRSVKFEIGAARRPWFYAMFLLCLTGLLGVAITGDAFNAFVFLEISSLSSYVLIALGRDRRALLAAYQYLIMGTIGATFYVIGVGFLYILTGSLNLVDIAARVAELDPAQSRALLTALAFITVGVCLKLALFPLHFWLPNAYAYAPSFVTVFLSATATKVAIYLLIRFYFTVFGGALDFDALPVMDILLVLSLAAMFVASIIAVFQTNLKRMLAYSSVAQIGYMTLGLSIANTQALTGSIVHMINHGIMKAALFLALGAVFYRVNSVRLSDICGIGRSMPITMTAFTLAGLGIIGVPGTAGFISKWYLATGALESGSWIIVGLIVGSSIISVVYIGRILEAVWLREPSVETEKAKDPPLSMLVPLIVLAAATIYLGLDTRATVGIASMAAEALVGGLR